jgi:guanylate kinase
MIVLIGKSGSGKDTILKELKKYGFNAIVSYTTRPKRHYEVDGVDYHFITEEEFMEKLKSDFFVEHTEYRGWHYGIAKKDCDENGVVIVEPNGLKQLENKIDDISVFYVEASLETRVDRLYKRGDDPAEIGRRIIADEELFKDVSSMTEWIINNDDNDMEELRMKVKQLVTTINKLKEIRKDYNVK